MNYDYGYNYGYDQISAKRDIDYDNQYMAYPKKQNIIYRNIPEQPKKEQFVSPPTTIEKNMSTDTYLLYFILFLFVVILLKIDNMMSHIQLIQLSLSKSSTM